MGTSSENHSSKTHDSIIAVVYLMEKYEMLFRFHNKTHEYLIINSRKNLDLTNKIRGRLLSKAPFFESSDPKYWDDIQNDLNEYNKIINDISMHIGDLRIKVMNSFFSKIFNILVPERIPQDTKHMPLKNTAFEGRSFLGHKYDWMSKFFWWL